MIPTREITWNVDLLGRIALYALLALPIGFLAFGLARRLRMWRLGRPDDRFDRLAARLWGAVVASIFHARIVRRQNLYGGIAHALIFWGFVVLFIGTVIVMIEHDITVPLFGFSFYRGNFYLGFKLAMNLAGLLLIAGVLMALVRRLVLRPVTLESSADDLVVLTFLLVLSVQGFVLQALRLAVERDPWAAWSFVSYPMSLVLQGLPERLLRSLHLVNWWSHMLTTTVFLAYVAFSKMIHPFTGLASVVFRRLQPAGKLEPIENLEEAERLGIAGLEDFTWAQLLHVDACMHCGRCLEYCPTFHTGKPLRPRDLILEIAGYVADRGGIFSGELGQGMNTARFRWGSGAERELIGGVVSTEEIWDCTTCGACMEQCPVYIEHVPLIAGLRRHLVLERGEFPNELTTVFNNLERLASPYQFRPAQRADWTKKLEQPVPEMAELAASGEEVEYLFWVGCLGSFDGRNQRTTIALARIMQAAGIRFAILGREETCTGDPARRAGNEYLAQLLGQQAVETLNAYQVKKIVTACPHCFNAIKNEFPQLGGHYEVVHHSQLISALLAQGRLRLDPDSAIARGKVTYHDPCYLGRYNRVFDEPRAAISALPGVELAEMRRNRSRSFCCGGGGGRMFMEESRGRRINQARVAEAQATGAEVLAAACPFCMTMFEDGIRGAGVEGNLRVLDIAELVAGSLVTPQEDGTTTAEGTYEPSG
uniref:(Fe-S)-binding protein n=1 Tax=Thermorudis peleae TaxID=1382356 RepID=A0A831TG11_9BACT